MNEIIQINYDSEEPKVSARELYKAVGSTERFANWFERQLQFGFVEGEDYSNPLKVLQVQVEGNREVQREVEDYLLSVDMAKHVCMIQKNEKARNIRQRLIELEKAWNTPEQVMARALKMADKTITGLKAENKALIEENQRMKPKEIFADAVSASDSSMLVRDVAKMIRQNGVPLGEKRFYKWLRQNGYICKNSTTPTQRAMEMGLFEIIVRTIERGDGLPLETKTAKITGRGQQYFINKFLAREAS